MSNVKHESDLKESSRFAVSVGDVDPIIADIKKWIDEHPDYTIQVSGHPYEKISVFKDDSLHRDNGPAVEYANGTKNGARMVNVTGRIAQQSSMLTAQRNGIRMGSFIVRTGQLSNTQMAVLNIG